MNAGSITGLLSTIIVVLIVAMTFMDSCTQVSYHCKGWCNSLGYTYSNSSSLDYECWCKDANVAFKVPNYKR